MKRDFDDPAVASAPTIKWAIVAALVILAGLFLFAPGDRAETASRQSIDGGRVTGVAPAARSGYRGPGPRFAEPQPRMTPYEEAQAWAAESAESETPTEAPPTF